MCIRDRGKTIFEGVEELRVKETDRINSMYKNLKKMGADIRIIKSVRREKIIIQGKKALKGANFSCFQDHRTAMSMIVAGSVARGNSRIDDVECISKSFPNFISILKRLSY